MSHSEQRGAVFSLGVINKNPTAGFYARRAVMHRDVDLRPRYAHKP